MKKVVLFFLVTLSMHSCNFFCDSSTELFPKDEFSITESEDRYLKEWFPKDQVAGNMAVKELAEKLAGLESEEFIEKLNENNGEMKLIDSAIPKRPWMYTSHSFGFIPAADQPSDEYKIINATKVIPDNTLKNSSIKIKLDRLVTMDYPGKGEHEVLFDFYAKNHLQGQDEHVHFNQIYRVQEGQQAGVLGYPVFKNLNVGTEGVDFKCYTVNVKNKRDQRLAGFLDSDLFKGGLTLLNQVNSVTPVLSKFAKGFTERIKEKNKNVAVQDVFLGLDLNGNIPTSAKLAQGSYIVIQIPDVNLWNWDEWKYKSSIGQIVSKNDETKGPPFNYFVFSVSKMLD